MGLESCGKQVAPAKNGKNRGACVRPHNHRGVHVSETCWRCASPEVEHRKRSQGKLCKPCAVELYHKPNKKKKIFQIPGSAHVFSRCGCEGILPVAHRVPSSFAAVSNPKMNGWTCRVRVILNTGATAARIGNYVAVPRNTPHEIIRKLMEEPLCVLCKELLDWSSLGAAKTPHLHHNHNTGEMYGFAHHKCNPLALENRIKELEERISQCTCKF